MKLNSQVVLFICLWCSSIGFSQTNIEPLILEHGGGPVFIEQEICLTPEQTADIERNIEENIKKLKVEGKLSGPTSNEIKKVTKFEWPLRQANGFDQPNYYSTTNYVDLDPSSGIQDFNCGTRSYDGHRGIGVSLWPYWWKMMEEDQVEVIAGAPGTIVSKQDGNFDENCTCTGNWNAVYVQHDDGSIVWYGHLKENSLTSKEIGETVVTGEYIGIVGSSGCSSNPHLHLEIRDADNNVIEPFQGNCNQTTTESWWQNQKPYREPALNLLMTHAEPPNLSNGFCPQDENANFVTQFNPGATIYGAAYYSDHLTTDPTTYSMVDPFGTILQTWTHSSNGNYSRSWWYWTFVVPPNAPQGTYTFEAEFLGETTIHKFQVGIGVATNEFSNIDIQIQPNPAKDYFQIVHEAGLQLNYELVNISGQLIDRGMLNSKQTRILTDNLTDGLYFLQIKNKLGELQAREKIVKLN